MSIHNSISIKITTFLESLYNNYLIKNKNTINELFNGKLFIYLQYYFIYSFFYNITYHNIIFSSISLHSIYICELIFKILSKKYNYMQYNTQFLINTSYYLSIYLFFFKICFLKIYLYYKIFFFVNFMSYYLLMNINDIYSKRLECINLKKEFYHPFKMIILSPNKNFLLNIINKTKYFTYSNFLIFINFLLFFI
jgi:hypothetical protein